MPIVDQTTQLSEEVLESVKTGQGGMLADLGAVADAIYERVQACRKRTSTARAKVDPT